MIHLIPTDKALLSLCDIEENTGLVLAAGGEMIKPERRPSLLFDMMYGLSKDFAELEKANNPFMNMVKPNE